MPLRHSLPGSFNDVLFLRVSDFGGNITILKLATKPAIIREEPLGVSFLEIYETRGGLTLACLPRNNCVSFGDYVVCCPSIGNRKEIPCPRKNIQNWKEVN